MTRTEKGLIYHYKQGTVLFDYYSIVDNGELQYIITKDGKEVDRDQGCIEENNFIRICHTL